MGNLDVSRDWGFAGDYVGAMWLMLQQEEPDDYVIATGKSHSIRDLLQVAFHHVGIEDWRPYVVQEERFFRPADIAILVGDATKARVQTRLASDGRLPATGRNDGRGRPGEREAKSRPRRGPVCAAKPRRC